MILRSFAFLGGARPPEKPSALEPAAGDGLPQESETAEEGGERNGMDWRETVRCAVKPEGECEKSGPGEEQGQCGCPRQFTAQE